MPLFYPLINYLQPGELWPVLAPYKPMLIMAVLAGLLALRRNIRPDGALMQVYFTQPVLFWLLVYVVVQVVSVYYGGVISMLRQLQYWEVIPIFIGISLVSLRDAAALRKYIWGTIIGSSFVIFYGIYAAVTHTAVAMSFHDAAVSYGLYDNPNDYTFIIIMVLPFIYLYLRVSRRLWQRIALLAALVGSVAAVVMSLSRGGMLALVLEVTFLVWLTMKGRRRFLALVLMSVFGVAASVHQFEARKAADAGSAYTAEVSADSRLALWHAALACFKAHPILGVGSGQFMWVASDYASLSHNDRDKPAHNSYIDVLANTGLLGFGSFMLMLAGIWRLFRGVHLADALGDGVIEAQVAGWVAFWGMAFRSLFDAKEHDWSFYFLIIVAVAAAGLAPRSRAAVSSVASPAAPAMPIEVGGRPAVYGQR